MARSTSPSSLVVDLAEDEEHLLLLLDVLGQLGLLGVDVLEVAPALEPDVEALEASMACGRSRRGQHLPEDLDGLLGVLEHLLVDLRGLEEERLLVAASASTMISALREMTSTSFG